MENLTVSNNIESNGTKVTYGRIPGGLVEGFDGLDFYFWTDDAFDAQKHENAVKPIIDELVRQNEDYGTRWVITKIDAVIWTEQKQVTVVSFRIRDSY